MKRQPQDQQQQRAINKIDKTILDNFYKLVHSQPNVRLTAAASTFKILAALKKRKFENFNENLNYSIDRLVAGLASSRALARRGYGTLLLEVLNTYQVSTERLFTIAHQKFGHISKETSRDNLIGYFLLISIVLQSGNHLKSKANSLYLEKVYKHLSQLLTIKSYLEYSVSKILVDYYDIFHSHMLVDIKPETLGSDSKLSSSDLLILTLCNKKEPIRKLTSLNSAELEDLYLVLLDEKFQKRPLQPVFAEVSKFVISTFPNQFGSFYSKVILPTFFKRNHNELAAMGLEYTLEMLKSTDEPTAIKTLLGEHLITLLILTMRGRKTLSSECTKFFSSLKEHFELLKNNQEDSSVSAEKQYNILLRLTSPPGSIAFDEDSKSSSINNLLQSSSHAVLKRYLDRIMNILHKKDSKDDKNKIQLSCARQIAFIVKRPQMIEDQSTLLTTAKFLLLSSIFRPNESKKESVEDFWSSHHISKPTTTFEEPVRTSLKNSYHAALDHIVSACNPQERIEQFNDLIAFAGHLLKANDIDYIVAESGSKGSVTKLWALYLDKLKSHREIVSQQKEPKQLYPLTTLYLFYGLQVIEYELDCESQLDELDQSVHDVLKGDPNDGSWADVLTDQIIAILSATECSSWIRKLCEKVFGSLLPHISQTSIDLLCNAIEANIEEEEASDEEDSDEYMDCDDGQVDSSARSNAVTMNGSKSDDDSSESDHEKNPSDHQALQTDEEEEEEYLDDEQMMKLDPIISEMFKMNRNKKKNDVSFNLRCLDLIKKILIKKHSDTETINRILATIIPLANSRRKSPVADKIVTILSKMPGKSKYPAILSSKCLTSKKNI